MHSAGVADTVQLEDSRRVQILEFIKANPGVHLRRIKRELNLAMGVLQYHLYRLEKDQAIVSRKRGLSEFARISASSTSWHMKRLIQAGLVESRRQGSFVYYIAKGDPAKILT